LILIAGLLSVAWNVEASGHPNIIVTTTDDTTKSDGFCSLREAIISANKNKDSTRDCVSGSGADVIELPAGTYTLTKSDNGKEDSGASGDLDITEGLEIRPMIPGTSVTINAIFGFRDRIFHIHEAEVLIQGVTISNGAPRADVGAIFNLGDLTIKESTISWNQAGGNGGAIYNLGDLTLINDTISGNSADDDGGGLYIAGRTVTSNNVTFARNLADGDSRQGGG
jgi:CSLREA domain-containing protein